MTTSSRTDEQLQNCAAYYSAYGRQEDGAGALLYRSGLAHPLMNGVMRWEGRDVGGAVEAARAHLAGVPWSWWAGPDSSPGTGSALEAVGAVHAGRMPVMGLRPEHRGRGIATLVSQSVLQAGFDAGLRGATLQPSEQGGPVYRRLGFEEWTAYDLYTDPDPAPAP